MESAAAVLERPDVGHGQDGFAGLVAGGQVYDGADSPVVVGVRVIEHLPDSPCSVTGLDVQQARVACVAAGADPVVVGEVCRQRFLPSAGVPAGVGVQRCEVLDTA